MAELLFFFNYKGERIQSKDLSGNVIPALNWQDAEKVIKRSDKYDGITYVFTNEFIFIGNIVRLIDIARANGIGEELGIEIWSLDEETLDHVQEYSGLVDLPSAKKEINASGNIQYTITTKQVGFESDFDFSFDTEVNLTEPTDLKGNPILEFARPFDYVGLQQLSLERVVDVERVGEDSFDAGQSISYQGSRHKYYFYTINHNQINRSELEGAFQDHPTREYTDYVYEGPDPTGVPLFNLSGELSPLRNSPESPINLGLYILKAKETGLYTIKYDWDFDFAFQAQGTAQVLNFRYWLLIVIVNRANHLYPDLTVLEAPNSRVTGLGIDRRRYEFNSSSLPSLNLQLNLNAEEELYIIPMQGNTVNPLVSGNVSTRSSLITVNKSNLRIEEVSKFGQTNATSYLAHEAFSRLTNKITGKFNGFRSSFYGRTDSQPRTYDEDGPGSLTAFMNGQHLRGWTIGNAGGSEKEFNTSFKDLFESEQAKHNIGLGVINNEIVIEDINFFYDKNTELLDLGCIPNLEIEYDLDEYYNRVEVGYSEWKNQENKGGAGLEEFNASKKYNTELNVIDKVLKIFSKYITAGYTIETTRREQRFLNEEKETQNDLKNFAIALLRTSTQIGSATSENPAFVNETFTGDSSNPWELVEGVSFPFETYNIRWQPARMIRNWGNRIRLSIDNSNKELLLQVTNGNKNFRSKLKSESEAVSEGDNITSSQLDPSLFNGELYTFEQRLTNDQIKAIETNPYGYVKFTDSFNKEYRGFFKGELSINLYTKIASATLRGYNF